MKTVSNTLLFSIFLLLSFPLFYFVYKFGDPEPLAHDYFQYYWLYKEFDSDKVIAPHNMRLVGAFFVYIFYKLNFFYDTVSAADKYQSWGFLKQVYFDALLFNFLSVAATCTLLFQLLNKQFQNILFSFVGALLYLSGFGTLFYELMPGTDAFSILLFVIVLRAYLDKKIYILVPLALLIFQREYLLIVMGTLALMDYLYHKETYFLKVFLMSVVFFGLHVLLRKTLFYTPHLDHQASGDYFLSNLFQINYSLIDYLKQLLMTLNLFLIYFGVLVYKKVKGLFVDGFSLLKLLVLFVQINIICHLAGHGNNCGRYFYMVVPLVIYEMLRDVYPLVNSERQESRS
jgi:hypothetical protein